MTTEKDWDALKEILEELSSTIIEDDYDESEDYQPCDEEV